MSDNTATTTTTNANTRANEWNPMGRFGNFLLKRYADSPKYLWIILQLGAALTSWMAIRLMVTITNTLAPILSLLWVSVHMLQSISIILLILGIHTAAHMLWMEMNNERQSRLLELYITTGKNSSMFETNPEALRMRADHLSGTTTTRRGRGRKKKHSN